MPTATTTPAIEFLQSYTGKNDFVLSVKSQFESGKALSPKQEAAILKFVARQNEPLVDTYAERKAFLDQIVPQLDEATAVFEAVRAEVTVTGTGVLGRCVKCRHSHENNDNCPSYVHYGYDDDYPCSCKEFVAPTPEQIELGIRFENAKHEFHSFNQRYDSAKYNESAILRGDHVVVARGRKVPKGVTGQVQAVFWSEWGEKARLVTDDGIVYVYIKNLDHV